MRARATIFAITGLLLMGLPVSAHATPAAPVDVGSLAVGGSVFWDGGSVGSSPIYSVPSEPSNSAIDRCALFDPCFVYTLTLAPGGSDVRIGFDTPMRDDSFEIKIKDPAGTVTQRTNNNAYSVEALIGAPLPGTWTITVDPYSAEYASFRMRAKLEATIYKPTPDGNDRLLPNLRVSRIWEFGFVAPANPLNGLFPPDDVNPPLDVFGVHPLSCAPDEMIDDGAKRCLRFSFGLANVGDGAFDIRYTQDRAPGAVWNMTQCVEHGTGAPEAFPAGTGSFHTTHGHVHYNDIIGMKLFKVTDRALGTMVPAGTGRKIGYSPADQAMPEWARFVQAPSGSSGSNGNCAPETTSRLGMSRGWGDAYRYQRPGNYVSFGDNSDGYYIAQVIADPQTILRPNGNVMESDDTDNTSYAYLHIVGEQIQTLETGRGSSPWDAGKVVYE